MIKIGVSHTLRARDVMTEALVVLQVDATLEAAWDALHQAGISGAPVLDRRGRLCGVLSMTDLADPRRRPPDGKVADAMTHMVYAVRVDDPALTAARLMIDEHIHRVVVLRDDGSLAGLVTPLDLLRALVGEARSEVSYVDLRVVDEPA